MNQTDYAPPAGPPPGWYGSHQQQSSSRGQNYDGHPPPGADPLQYHPPPPQQPPRPQNDGYFPGKHGLYANAQGGPQYNPHPPGPPPSHAYGPSRNHYPPPPPPQSVGGQPSHHHYGPPPPQQQQRNPGHAFYPGVPPPASSRGTFRTGFTQLPPKIHVWTKTRSDGETYFEFGAEPKGQALYSAKMGASGRMKFKTGKYESGAGVAGVIGEANNKGLLGSKSVISFGGREYELSKSRVSLTSEVYTFSAPNTAMGGRVEEWQWVAADKSLTARLSGQKGWKLVRKGSTTPAESEESVAVWKDESGLGLSSKEGVGVLEFVGRGLTGELGDVLPNVAVMSLTKMKAQQMEKAIIKAVTGGI